MPCLLQHVLYIDALGTALLFLLLLPSCITYAVLPLHSLVGGPIILLPGVVFFIIVIIPARGLMSLLPETKRETQIVGRRRWGSKKLGILRLIIVLLSDTRKVLCEKNKKRVVWGRYAICIVGWLASVLLAQVLCFRGFRILVGLPNNICIYDPGVVGVSYLIVLVRDKMRCFVE